METENKKNRRVILDIFTMKEIDISNNLKLECSKLNIDYTAISKIEKNGGSVNARYISPSFKDKIFKLQDLETKQIYNCITNISLFIQLNLPYNENDSKYIYELKSKRQKYASICNRVFTLVGNVNTVKIKKLKVHNEEIETKLIENKLKYRIKLRLSKRIWDAFNKQGQIKIDKTLNLIGCNINDFKSYISSRFIEGMTFDNYGEWHIDHIKPCSHFNLTDDLDIKAAFHYTNMQPLWATTEIAEKYGHNNYIGNMNKGNSNLYSDYYLAKLIKDNISFISEEDAHVISDFLFRNGVKKLIPKGTSIIDNSNDIPLQDGSK